MREDIRKELLSLYRLYRFDAIDESSNYIVFQYNKGYFNNIEILVIEKDYDITTLKKEYTDLGYAVISREFFSINQIHNALFLGFFEIDNLKKRINNEYLKFCEMQTQKKVTSDNYKYIECNYTLNYEKGTGNLVDYITEEINGTNAKLIIVEAAAGYGKTCTSYEILHNISLKYDKFVPLLAELSKNRKASIFRYVLQSEVNSNFPGLTYEIVEKEILDGNIPLIIDGFDELLSKSIDIQSENDSDLFHDSQTMLDTISFFLTDNSRAKVILTSRKSSIFTGDIFDSWIERRQIGCDICRIQLDTPNIVKWIGHEKAEYIKANMSELNIMTCPILLDVINEISITDLASSTVETVIKIYFDKLISREKVRQALRLNEDEQYNVMRLLASFFVDMDISSEEPRYLSEVIEMLIEGRINEYIDRYTQFSESIDENIPSKEEFILKLVHHAFLDRISSTKSNIGFINEFIFGFFIGEAIIKEQLDSAKLSYKYLDLAVTAFSFRSSSIRKQLLKKVDTLILSYDSSKRLYFEEKLIHHASANYMNSSFSSIRFSPNFSFSADHVFTNCIFYECVFDNCNMSTNAFVECQFINCKFFTPTINDKSEIENQLIFISCIGYEDFCKSVSQFIPQKSDEKSYRKILLEQFWKPGKERAERRCGINTVYRGIDKNDMRFIDDELQCLTNEGLIFKRSVCYELNFARINEIKDILGR